MAIDRTGRDRLRNALIGYMQMHTTSEPFAQCDMDFAWNYDNPDHSLVVIAELLYNIFDDFSDHPILPDRQRVERLLACPWPEADDDQMLREQKAGWLFLCRTQAFLKTDLEINPALKSTKIEAIWKRYRDFSPFASPEQAESYKATWLNFSPPFDPTMMEKEIRAARPSWFSRLLNRKLFA